MATAIVPKLYMHRAPARPNRKTRAEWFLCEKCHKNVHGEVRFAKHQATCNGPNKQQSKRCEDCRKPCPPGTRACVRHTIRGAEMKMLDYLIEWGYGDVPQRKIDSWIIIQAARKAGVIHE